MRSHRPGTREDCPLEVLSGRWLSAARRAATDTAFCTVVSLRWCRCSAPERGSTERMVEGNTHCQPHSRAALGYLTSSASGSHSVARGNAPTAGHGGIARGISARATDRESPRRAQTASGYLRRITRHAGATAARVRGGRAAGASGFLAAP
jgi:hypothetical protein